ncbi:MAG: sulfatase-like hydrolase/transferase, partial [Ferruginibacter sp.]
MTLLKKIPFFLILLVLFFCLHGWLENFGFISFKEVLSPGVFIFLGIALFTAVVFLFTKDLLFASLIVFFISLWYLFFGALHDWVRNIPLLSFIKSYTAMLLTLLLFTGAWVIFLRKKKTLHPKLALYLNILLLIYCLVDVFSFVKAQTTRSTVPVVDGIKFDTTRVTQKPDVYLLLFDEYPGFASLKDSFNFANDSLRNYFTIRSFKILPVFSNYDLTYFSMSSMLNMQYLKKDFNNLQLTQRDFQRRGVEINHASLFPIFRSMGYNIRNFSIFDIDEQQAVSVENSFLLANSILLTDKILHNRLNRDLGDRLCKMIPFWKNSDFYQHDIDNKLSEKLLLNAAVEKKSEPQFVYTHFMMPHGPYYFDSLGNKNPFEKISHYTMWKDKPLFVAYLKYINKRMINMVNTLITHKPNAIIIVMGDHGYRSFNNENIYQAPRYDNLCAVRFPDNKHQQFKERWSMVNLFRYVFNCE